MAGDGECLHELAQTETEHEHGDHDEPQRRIEREKGHQKEPNHHRQRAGSREPLVAAGARHDLSRHDARDHHPENHRQHLESALCRSGPLDELKVQRDGHHGTEHAEANKDTKNR